MMVVATLLFAAMDASAKFIGPVLPLALVLFVRYAIQAAAMIAWIAPTRGRAGFRAGHPRFQLARGVLLVVVSGMAFVSVQAMPLAEFTAIIMLWPVLATVVAAVLFRERVGPLRWALVAGGFIGTLIVVRPGSGIFGWAAALPVATLVLSTAYNVLTSRLAVLDDPYTTQFHTGAVGTVALAPWVLAQAGPMLDALNAAPPVAVGLMLMLGVFGALGHLLIVMAFARAGTATLMPFIYAQIAFAALLGWLVFKRTPDAWAWFGMSIIAACGAATAWINVRAAQRAGVPPAALEPAAD